jgi:hypothetical protein
MVRKDVMLREDQIISLENIPGNTSEHIRAAIDDYIVKKQKEKQRVSFSPSYGRK